MLPRGGTSGRVTSPRSSASYTLPATVTSAAAPALTLLKSATPGTVTSAGQTVTYSFQLVNNGNTTLTGVTAADTTFSGSGTPPVVNCPVTTLAPGASTTCTGTYTVTQTDIDAGSITNTGRASGVPVTGMVVNSHLIEETSAATIREGVSLAESVTRNTGVGIAFVAVEKRMLSEFDVREGGHPVLVLSRQMLKPWEQADGDREQGIGNGNRRTGNCERKRESRRG